MIDPTALKQIIRDGLLSFPVTPFDADDAFNPTAFTAHLEWLSAHPVAGRVDKQRGSLSELLAGSG